MMTTEKSRSQRCNLLCPLNNFFCCLSLCPKSILLLDHSHAFGRCQASNERVEALSYGCALSVVASLYIPMHSKHVTRLVLGDCDTTVENFPSCVSSIKSAVESTLTYSTNVLFLICARSTGMLLPKLKECSNCMHVPLSSAHRLAAHRGQDCQMSSLCVHLLNWQGVVQAMVCETRDIGQLEPSTPQRPNVA
jgi:hypothetical protein